MKYIYIRIYSNLYEMWVCGLLLAGIVGSNPTGDMDVCLNVSIVCCQVKVCASGWSLIQSRLIVCDNEASIMNTWLTGGVVQWKDV